MVVSRQRSSQNIVYRLALDGRKPGRFVSQELLQLIDCYFHLVKMFSRSKV